MTRFFSTFQYYIPTTIDEILNIIDICHAANLKINDSGSALEPTSGHCHYPKSQQYSNISLPAVVRYSRLHGGWLPRV